MNCPICNKELQLSDTYCPECGFERHIYSEPLSPELKKYEEERIKKYKEQRTKKEKELKKQEDAFNKVSSQLSETHDRLKQKDVVLKSKESEAQTYKQKNVQLEKNLAELQREIELARSLPQEDPVLGFLVLGQNSETFSGNVQYEILDVFRIYDGENLFGRMPQERDNVHSNNILFKCPEMKKEHFSIDASNDGDAIANLKDGRWGVRNKDNNVRKEFLIDRDEIFIGNLIFTYIKL